MMCYKRKLSVCTEKSNFYLNRIANNMLKTNYIKYKRETRGEKKREVRVRVRV